MRSKERNNASRELVHFVAKHSQVIEQQLVGVREVMNETVDELMENIQELASQTKEKASKANEVIEQTYLEPDEKTKDLINVIQKSVDSVFADALKDTPASIQPEEKKSFNLIDTRLRRFGGMFAKHMEALGSIESVVAGALFKMMATLSSDDLLRQRLEHVIESLNALQVSVAYILTDFDRRFNDEGVEKIQQELKDINLDLYTTEKEKEIFYKVFGKD